MSSNQMLYIAATSHQTELRRLAGQQRHRADDAAGRPSLSHRLLHAISHARASRAARGTVVQRRYA